MTLVPFTPDQLDQLALRLIDLGLIARRMSVTMRENYIPEYAFPAHKLESSIVQVKYYLDAAEKKLNSQAWDKRRTAENMPGWMPKIE